MSFGTKPVFPPEHLALGASIALGTRRNCTSQEVVNALRSCWPKIARRWFLIREALKESGVECTVLATADRREVLAIISQGDDATCRSDLIIVDLNLPRHNGIEILQKVRSVERIVRVPVVVLASSDSPRDRLTADELGTPRSRRKPSNLEHLLQLCCITIWVPLLVFITVAAVWNFGMPLAVGCRGNRLRQR